MQEHARDSLSEYETCVLYPMFCDETSNSNAEMTTGTEFREIRAAHSGDTEDSGSNILRIICSTAKGLSYSEKSARGEAGSLAK